MTFVVRGIFWFGLYFFLVTFPLLAAVVADSRGGSPSFLANVGIAAGYLAFSMMALEMALVSRVRAAANAFGQDALLQFHVGMGLGSLLLVAAHPLLLVVGGGYPIGILSLGPGIPWAVRLGTLAALAAFVLVATSLSRRWLRIHYETWQLLHGILALLVVVLGSLHVVRAGRFSDDTAMHAVELAYMVLFVGVFVRYRIVRPIELMRKPWEVVEVVPETGSAWTLRVRPVGHDGFSFEPGQFSWLNLGGTPFHLEQHPISMSSDGDVAPGGEIAFTIRNLGDWSGRQVPSLRPGQRVWVDGPYGAFSIDRDEGPGFVLIAGGVGITPMVSTLETMASREDVRPVVLFHGARSAEDLILGRAIEAVAPRLNLRVVQVLEHPPEGWRGERGLITIDLLRRHLPRGFERWQFFTCGPPPLMDAMEVSLPALGVPPEHVHAERFDMV